MKFGKNIARVVELSDPEWAPFWMNYKFLKKKIKGLEEQDAMAAADPSSPEAIAKSAGEVAFFKLTRQELRKCSDFFSSVEQQFAVRRCRVVEGWKQLRSPDAAAIADGSPHKRLMAACVKLYKELLLLENYAIMTYCSFSKILKKHDKMTGFKTRERFMKNVVNLAPFARYPRVMEMLSEVENLFKEIQVFSSKHVAHDSEEQLFIDAMRTINVEATKLQRQETADIGMSAAEFEGLRSSPAATAPVAVEGSVTKRQRSMSDGCACSVIRSSAAVANAAVNNHHTTLATFADGKGRAAPSNDHLVPGSSPGVVKPELLSEQEAAAAAVAALAAVRRSGVPPVVRQAPSPAAERAAAKRKRLEMAV